MIALPVIICLQCDGAAGRVDFPLYKEPFKFFRVLLFSTQEDLNTNPAIYLLFSTLFANDACRLPDI